MRNPILSLTVGIVLGTTLGGALPAVAAWAPEGTPVTSDIADQAFPVLTTDGAGGTIVAWQEFGRIFAQRLTSAGDIARGWPADVGLEVSPTAPEGAYFQCAPRVASDGVGGAFVLWHDQRNAGCQFACFSEPVELYLERITRDGTIAHGWAGSGLAIGSNRGMMTFTAGKHSPRAADLNTVMTPDGLGGVIIAWEEAAQYWSDSTTVIRAQRVSADGDLQWGAHGIVVAESPFQHWYPAIAPDAEGGAFVVWQETRETVDVPQLYGQHVSPSGARQWADDGVRMTHGSGVGEAWQSLVPDGAGGAILAWQAGDDAAATVLAQRVSTRGQLAWMSDASLASGSGGQTSPALASDADGNAWLTWLDGRDAKGTRVYAQKLNRWGTPDWGWPRDGAVVSMAADGPPSGAVIAHDGVDGAYVGWFVGRFLPRATRITRFGGVDAHWPSGGAHLSDSDLGDYQMNLAPSGAAGAFVVWSEGRPPNGGYSMSLAQYLSPTGLGAGQRGIAGLIGDHPFPLPGAPRLALAGMLPNPAFRTPVVSFSLPDDAPARLELFDVIGRRVAAREVGALGAGHHVVDLGAERPLPTGTYLIRLTRADRTLVSRGTIVR